MSLLTSFSIILLFGSSLQKSRLCDRSDTSLVIDSAIAYPSGIGFKVLLFSGDVLYELESVNGSEIHSNFKSKPIKELSPQLEAPINIATMNSMNGNSLLFINIEQKKGLWFDHVKGEIIDYPLKNFTEHIVTGLYAKAIDCFEMSTIEMFFGDVCIHNEPKGNFYMRGLQKYSLIERNDSQMKIIQSNRFEVNTKPFDGTIRGVAITAAFNWTQSDKEFVYFFAGRHLCRQEISLKWVAMCEIQDISDLVIGCSHEDQNITKVSPRNHTQKTTDLHSYTTDQTPYETDYTVIVVISSIVAFILLVVALVLVVVYIEKNKDKQKEEPTLRFIDNKSTKHLHSDIPSPKPKTDESDDCFDIKSNSSNTSNKKINTKKSRTTLSDM